MELTPDVELVVDELDLAAVPAARRHVVVAVFERELARLVERRPPSPTGGGEPLADRVAPRVRARPDGDPVVFGAELARAVHAALGGWAR